MSTRKHNKILEEFIEIYKSEPCLWRVKSKQYHDRTLKEAAYARLIEKLQEIEPGASKDTVIKKINNLRSNVRKEKKKIEASMKSGASSLYKPTLWYYYLFDFLSDQKIPRAYVYTVEEEESGGEVGIEKDTAELFFKQKARLYFKGRKKEISSQTLTDTENTEISADSNVHVEEETCRQPSRHKLNKTKTQEELTTDVLMSVPNNFKRPLPQEDRYDMFGKIVAMKLKCLNSRQRLVAEKVINDVLFEAEMGNLTCSAATFLQSYTDIS